MRSIYCQVISRERVRGYWGGIGPVQALKANDQGRISERVIIRQIQEEERAYRDVRIITGESAKEIAAKIGELNAAIERERQIQIAWDRYLRRKMYPHLEERVEQRCVCGQVIRLQGREFGRVACRCGRWYRRKFRRGGVLVEHSDKRATVKKKHKKGKQHGNTSAV